MSGLLLPILLAAIGFVVALVAYRGIRRGGARFYTLEREAMLRRASFSLLLSVLLFLAAISLLMLERQQTVPVDATTGENEAVEGLETSTPEPIIQQFPPTETPIPTVDPLQPTPTLTPVVCRASIEETGGSGLTLRDAAGGNEIRVLPEGSIVTLLDDAAVEANGLSWRQVRVLGGEEGWVAEDYLAIGAPCN